MKHTPLVTVCVPVFNGVHTIKRALDSVLHQSYKNVELVVSDNASDDGTDVILREYKNNAKIVRSETNMGMMWNWRNALSIAKGDFVIFLGADDCLHNNYILELMNGVDETHKFSVGSTQYVLNDQILDFIYNPSSLETESEWGLFCEILSSRKVNLFINGAFCKDVWREMLSHEYKMVRGVNLDRIAILKAIILAGGNHKINNTVPYYKNKFKTDAAAEFVKRQPKAGSYVLIAYGISMVLTDLKKVVAKVYSVYAFFNEIVLVNGGDIGGRVRGKFIMYWAIWSINKVLQTASLLIGMPVKYLILIKQYFRVRKSIC